jgi:hypothetical protein
MEKLEISELSFILESLSYTKLKFENYPIGRDGYTTYEDKQKKMQQVEDVIKKVRDILNNKKNNLPI